MNTQTSNQLSNSKIMSTSKRANLHLKFLQIKMQIYAMILRIIMRKHGDCIKAIDSLLHQIYKEEIAQALLTSKKTQNEN